MKWLGKCGEGISVCDTSPSSKNGQLIKMSKTSPQRFCVMFSLQILEMNAELVAMV